MEKFSQKDFRYLLAPITGTLPIVAFFVTDFFADFNTAFFAGLLAYALLLFLLLAIQKTKLPYTLHLTGFILLFFITFSIIKPFNLLYIEHSTVVFEIFLMLVFYIFLLIKDFYQRKITVLNNYDRRKRMLQFGAVIYVVRTTLHAVSLHLLIILIYLLFPEYCHTEGSDRLIYFYCLFFFIATHYTLEFYQYAMVVNSIKKEEWLPIVNETGAVHGKVARSESKKLRNKYLHPVVRIALIHKGRLFLKERSVEMSNGQTLDYPFERFVRFGESLDKAIKNTFKEHNADKDLPYNYIFRYIYRNEETNRLIYLCACNLHSERSDTKIDLRQGRWWTGKQISDNLKTGIFSEYFENEFEFINSTVLAAEKIMNP
jgi:hypothetical protein